MKKILRCIFLMVCLSALCLTLSGCENEDERVRRALIDMGYMEQTIIPEVSPSVNEGDDVDGAMSVEAPTAPENLLLSADNAEKEEMSAQNSQDGPDTENSSTENDEDPDTEKTAGEGILSGISGFFSNISTSVFPDLPDSDQLDIWKNDSAEENTEQGLSDEISEDKQSEQNALNAEDGE